VDAPAGGVQDEEARALLPVEEVTPRTSSDPAHDFSFPAMIRNVRCRPPPRFPGRLFPLEDRIVVRSLKPCDRTFDVVPGFYFVILEFFKRDASFRPFLVLPRGEEYPITFLSI
jgi:hypothetical protein